MANEIYHFGIPRRSGRYPWGSGERPHQSMERAKGTESEEKRPTNKEVVKQRKSDSDDRRTLTNEELSERIERIKLEKKLKEVTDEDLKPGRTAIKKILADSGKKIATQAATGIGIYMVKTYLEAVADKKLTPDLKFKDAFKKAFNPQDFGSSVFNGGPKKKS